MFPVKDTRAGRNDLPKVYILHENSEWVAPLHLQNLEIPFEEWFLNEGYIDFEGLPPEGIFYNRISASSHSRGNRFAPELTKQTLSWLQLNDRRVVNDLSAVEIELGKFH